MPKEYINDESDSSGLRVKVGWSKECGDIQIATTAPNGVELSGEHPESNGWFVSLDRRGINQLIRTLRKARDQALGSDA